MKTQKGFTIVELLIAIVIIGILSAITLVTFNGIQSRAKVSKKQTEMSSMSKANQSYNVINPGGLIANSSSTQAQKDAALSSLGLSGLKDSIVFDNTLILNDNSCLQSPMTKDKYCLSINGEGIDVVYWHDQQKKWIIREYYQGSWTESDGGTGNYPDPIYY